MRFIKPICGTLSALVIALGTQSCSNYDPVPASDCAKVVKHAKKVLGDMAPSRAEMLRDCKKATDSQRGCVMAATKKGKLAQCM